MSSLGLSGKQHGEKPTVSGKKYQTVNINNVFHGKSVVSSKSSAPAGKHGLQSLGKATAVTRRMPPPVQLSSLKSESAGQDPSVNLVPTGNSGWGNTQQIQQDSAQIGGEASSLKTSQATDAVSLRPATSLNVPASTAGGSSPSSTSSAATRPTWSTRIGTSTVSSANNGASTPSTLSATSPAAAGFFATHSTQEFPKLANEKDALDGSGPSLRPQKAGSWKSGGAKLSASATSDDVSAKFQSGHDSSSSSEESPAPPSQQVPFASVPHGSHRPASAPQQPPPHSMYPPFSVPPPPSHAGGRYGAPPPPPFPFPHYPPYGPGMYPPPPHTGGRYPQQQQNYSGGNFSRKSAYSPTRMPPTHKGDRGEASYDDTYVGSRHSGPPPPNYHRGQPPPMGPQPYDREMSANRAGSGDQWSGYNRDLLSSPMDQNRYEERGVWSDDEIERERGRRYHQDTRRVKQSPMDERDMPLWWDGVERYDHEYDDDRYTNNYERYDDYDERRMGGRGPPPAHRPYPPQSSMYGPPPPQHMPMSSRDSRYMSGPPPQAQPPAKYGYVNYEQQRSLQQQPPQQPHIPYPPVPVAYAVRDPRDLEAEEQEEMVRQHKQQYARDAAIERSLQKRMLAQQVSTSSGAPSEQSGLNEIGNEILKRPDSKESISSHSDMSSIKADKLSGRPGAPGWKWAGDGKEIRRKEIEQPPPIEDEEDENKFEVLTKPAKVVKRTVGSAKKGKESAVAKDIKDEAHQQQQQHLPVKKEPEVSGSVAIGAESGDARAEKKAAPKQQGFGENTEPQQNFWEKRRKEKQMENSNSNMNCEYGGDESYSRRQKIGDKSVKQLREASDENRSDDYNENWGRGQRDSARGRGLTRGRVRREFVSSRRIHHEGASLSSARRGSNRLSTVGGGARRGHSVPYESGDFRTKLDRSGKHSDSKVSTKRRSAHNDEEYNEDYPEEDSKNNAKDVGVENSSLKNAPKSTESSAKVQAVDIPENQTLSTSDDYRSSQQVQSRRDERIYSYNNGSNQNYADYKSGYYGQSSGARNRAGGSGSKTTQYYGRSDGKRIQDYRDVDQEFDPNKLKDVEYSDGSYFVDNRPSRGSRRTGTGVPPRFSSRGNGGYGDNYNSEQTRSKSGRQSSSRGYQQNSTKSASTVHQPAAVAKSPTGQRDNQSEGNDEWETASESSDVGERRRRKTDKKDDSSDKKRPTTNAPKSFNAQRRPIENSRGSASSAATGGSSNHLIWGPNSGPNRPRHHNNNHNQAMFGEYKSEDSKGTSSKENKGDIPQQQQPNKLQNGPKNANVASLQAPSGVVEHQNSTDAHHQSPNRNNQTTSKKTAKKEEKPASKTDALATVNLNNIAGVVVIDDQPDTVSIADSQDGFQEVVSKKERRNRKDLQQQDDTDRKSQSPVRLLKLQPRGGSIGSKREKEEVGHSVKSQNHSVEVSKNVNQKFVEHVHEKITSPVISEVCQSPAVVSSPSPWDQRIPFASSHVSSSVGNVPLNASSGSSSSATPVFDVRSSVPSNLRDDQVSSKTGVEIWGTPDPVPFSGAASEQAKALNQQAKCVVRPNKQTDHLLSQPKSVEFVSEGFRNVVEETRVKIDFTFDADLAHSFDANNKDKQVAAVSQNAVQSGGSCHESQQQQVLSMTSPSTDQLSEKIASVKKVWDNATSLMDDGSQSNQGDGGAYFSAEAQSAAIAGAAFSMSQAVLQSEGQGGQTISYEGDGIIKATNGGPARVANTSAQPSPTVISKMDGPNVAKVRPQQMRVVDSFPRQQSFSKIDETIMGNVYLPPMSSPTAVGMYGNPSSVLFPQYHMGGKQAASQNDPFGNANAIRPYVYQQVNGQSPLFMNAQSPLDPASFNNLYRPATPSGYPNSESFAYAVGVQAVRPPPPVGQSSLFPPTKGATNTSPFLLQDANASLFTQPPPPLAAAAQQNVLGRMSQPPPPSHQPPAVSTNVYPFAPQSTMTPAMIPSFGGQQSFCSSSFGQNPAPNSNFGAPKSSADLTGGQTYNNWGNPTTAPPSSLPVGNKFFNRTIGQSPNPQQKSSHAPLNAALINLLPVPGNVPPPPFANTASMGVGAVNLGLSSSSGMYAVHNATRNVASMKPQQIGNVQQSPGGGDHSKRDGDLLQQMDNFINSTGSEEESLSNANPASNVGNINDCCGNASVPATASDENDC